MEEFSARNTSSPTGEERGRESSSVMMIMFVLLRFKQKTDSWCSGGGECTGEKPSSLMGV